MVTRIGRRATATAIDSAHRVRAPAGVLGTKFGITPGVYCVGWLARMRGSNARCFKNYRTAPSMTERKHKTFADGFAAIFKNFGELIERIESLSRVSADEDRRESESDSESSDAPIEGVFGFSIKTGARAGPGRRVRVERFGNIRREKDAQSARVRVSEIREPMTDVFEEADHVLVVAEMPGVAASELELELHGDVLILSSERASRKYRKELLLPRACVAPPRSLTSNNGVVEIKHQIDPGDERSSS